MKLILFLFVFSVVDSFASEPQLIKAESQFMETSDQLTLQKSIIESYSNRRDILWPYSGAQEKSFDLGLRYSALNGDFKTGSTSSEVLGQKLEAFMGQKWASDSYTGLYLGYHKFDYDSLSSEVGIYELFHTQKYKNLDITLRAERDMYYLVRTQADPLIKGLTYQASSISGVYRPKENWRVPFVIEKSSISDGNNSTSQRLSLLYGRSYPTWVWVGYGMESLSYEKDNVSYWAPKEFMSHGPQVEFSRMIWEKIEVSMGYSYNTIKERSFKEGTSTYGTLKLQYGDRNSWFAGVEFFDNESEQASNQWRAQGSRIFFQRSF